MNEPSASATGSSFFDLWRSPGDGAAWARFAGRYRPKIFAWACQSGLSKADADDVTQTLLIQAFRGFRTFDPQMGRFRDWLKAATRNTGRRFLAGERRARRVAWDEKLRALLARPEVDEGFGRLIDGMCDQEIFLLACQHLERRSSPNGWNAFRRRVLEAEPLEVVAEALQMTPAAVTQACYRTRNRLRQAIRQIEAGEVLLNPESR